MASPNETFQDRMKNLRTEYRQLLPLKLSQIDSAWAAAVKSGPGSEHCKSLRLLVHSLAGSGSTFGYSKLSERAKQAEDRLVQIMKGKGPFQESEIAEMDSLLAHLRQSITQAEPEVMEETAPVKAKRNLLRTMLQVYWLGKDMNLAGRIKNHFNFFGIQVTINLSLQELQRNWEDQEPDVVFFDMVSADGPFPDQDEAFLCFRRFEANIPILCLGPPGDSSKNWLHAARSGATSCYDRDMSPFEYLEKVDQLWPRQEEKPYRLFIVEDDELLAKNTATIMAKAGMEVRFVNDPLNALDSLADFDPDLILLDLYMPGCSGLELAKLIRQDPRFKTIPLVYLSKETETNQILAAFEAGADDFIFKPVKYRYLYHSLAARIKRARSLRLSMDCDSLTGLIQPTAFQGHLRREWLRSETESASFVYALFDVDHFKKINREYGYEEGDRVLQTLTILFLRGFGSRAILCRESGDRFQVILPRTEEAQAREILNRVKGHFRQIVHGPLDRPFQASVSFGCSGCSHYTSLEEVLDAAQSDLDKAKQVRETSQPVDKSLPGGNHEDKEATSPNLEAAQEEATSPKLEAVQEESEQAFIEVDADEIEFIDETSLIPLDSEDETDN